MKNKNRFFPLILFFIFLFSLMFGVFLRFLLENNFFLIREKTLGFVQENLQQKDKNKNENNNIIYPSLDLSYKEENFKEDNLNLVDRNIEINRNDFQELNLLKEKLINEEKDFIEVDLSLMKLNLYEKGKVFKTFNVLTKGREGSWWETPTGFYKVLSKEVNKFSYIGGVWMPYSLQFFGNFFIHGWPYYPNGIPVASTYSGGCIRLSTQDAKEIFNFAQKDMPILIFEKEKNENEVEKKEKEELFLKKINFFETLPPIITASSALVLNLDTGLIYLNKNAQEILPIASLTKLMTAIVVSELIYLEKPIKINFLNEIFRNKTYSAFDLLYPLLMQSSNEVAELFSSYVGEKNFVFYMNDKAKALNMNDSVFVDASGKSKENVSTAFDLAKLGNYIFKKRYFIFAITLGKKFNYFGNVYLANLKNYNEFTDKENLIGVKNGYINASKETLLTLWQLTNKELNFQGNFLIIVLGSDDRKRDTQEILSWLKNNFQLE